MFATSRFLGYAALLLLLIPPVAAMDLSRGIILDVPDKIAEKQFGPLPPSQLTAEEQKAMASFRFVNDTMRVLAIPVEWDDRPGTWPRATLDSMLFSRDVYSRGSVADYFHEVSYGKVAVVGTVLDWYNAGLYNPYFDFEDILPAIDTIVDFSQYDGNNDDDVDAVIFLRSGTGEEDSQDPNDIWSYAYIYGPNGGPGPFDGKYVSRWNTSPELVPLRDPNFPIFFSGEDTLNNIRVFCHELSHNFGMPDLYDYDAKLNTNTYFTPADSNDHPLVDWCLMGYGGYGLMSLKSKVPSHLCGWNKMLMDWVQPIDLVGTFEDLVIYDIETHDDSSLYRVPINPAEGEYFLLEFRNPRSTGKFDKTDSDFSVLFWPDLTYGPDTLDRGLLITHVHDSLGAYFWRINSGWPDYPHYTVAVEDAGYNPGMDQSFNPEGHVTDSAQWWYPWETRRAAPFSDDVAFQEEFGPATYPGSDGYDGPSGIVVRVDSIVGGKLYAYVNNPLTDSDGDLIDDDIDNCPFIYNPDQTDLDGDGIGYACENCVDIDGDGYGDPGYSINICPDDNCPGTYNPDQTDSDGDGVGDSCLFRWTVYDTIATSCLRLTVSNTGNCGHAGLGGVNMDYATSGDCDPEAFVYIYDGSPLLNYFDSPSQVNYYSMYSDQPFHLVTDRGWPVATQTTPDYDIYQSGTFVTPDSFIAMERTWWAPKHPDSCDFIIQLLRLYSYDGETHPQINICEAIDWDIPTDGGSYPYNRGGYDSVHKLLYIQGMEWDGSGCQSNAGRYGGLAMIGVYSVEHAMIDTGFEPYSAHVVDNDTYIFPYGGWNPYSTRDLIENPGYHVHADSTDLSILMTYFPQYGFYSPADTLQIYSVLTSVHNDASPDKALDQLIDNVVAAKQWTNDHIIPFYVAPDYFCGDTDGDTTINISDAVYIINYIFKGGPPPDPLCIADAGGDGSVNIADAIHIINYIFKGGPPPVEPCCP